MRVILYSNIIYSKRKTIWDIWPNTSKLKSQLKSSLNNVSRLETGKTRNVRLMLFNPHKINAQIVSTFEINIANGHKPVIQEMRSSWCGMDLKLQLCKLCTEKTIIWLVYFWYIQKLLRIMTGKNSAARTRDSTLPCDSALLQTVGVSVVMGT